VKIVLYNDYKPGLLKGRDRVVDVSDIVPASPGKPVDGQHAVEAMVRGFDTNRTKLDQALLQREGVPIASVRLRAPTPRPSKIVCMGANYREETDKPGLPIMVFLKSPEAVLDPGGTIVLPPLEFSICHHEAEMTLVIGKDARNVAEAQAMDYVFGYMNGVDVSCRGPWGGNIFTGKSFDTFAPLGPWITTRDEIADPDRIQIRFWVDGAPRHNYNTSDLGHRIPECIAYASSIMTLRAGDVLMLGTNHQGIGPLQGGEHAEMEVDGLGRLTMKVSDSLKRTWPKEIDRKMAAYVRDAVLQGSFNMANIPGTRA